MSSLTKDENRQKQVKLGALVATAALATTFAGATAVHADTVRSTPQSAGKLVKRLTLLALNQRLLRLVLQLLLLQQLLVHQQLLLVQLL